MLWVLVMGVTLVYSYAEVWKAIKLGLVFCRELVFNKLGYVLMLFSSWSQNGRRRKIYHLHTQFPSLSQFTRLLSKFSYPKSKDVLYIRDRHAPGVPDIVSGHVNVYVWCYTSCLNNPLHPTTQPPILSRRFGNARRWEWDPPARPEYENTLHSNTGHVRSTCQELEDHCTYDAFSQRFLFFFILKVYGSNSKQ
jgi:hypothetical protein